MTDALNAELLRMAEGASPGAILEVRAPARGLSYRNATGLFERGGKRLLNPDDGFRIASTSKLFTGTLCLQLAESGLLDLDAPVSDYVDVSAAPVVAGHEAGEITVWHLLTHTSGLWDFAQSPEWGSYVLANRESFFDPREILAWAFEHGQSVGAPGEQFHYSDTGYVVLGLMLESIVGKSWAQQCRERIIDPLEMTSTWLEGYEDPRSTLSHTYLGDIDGLDIHGSVDWAAGGHVSTTTDLIHYIRAMARGELFTKAETHARWRNGVPTEERGRYGAGVSLREFGGHQTIGHGGFWGSFLFHAPDADISVAGTINLVESRVDLLDDIFSLFS